MLEVLKSKKDLYRKVHPSMFGDGCFASQHSNEYDAVIVSGGLGEGHMPVGAIGDSVELLRPGGLFVCVVSVQHGELCQNIFFDPYPKFFEDQKLPQPHFFPRWATCRGTVFSWMRCVGRRSGGGGGRRRTRRGWNSTGREEEGSHWRTRGYDAAYTVQERCNNINLINL